MKSIFCFLALLNLLYGQDYEVSIDYPFLVSDQYTKILDIKEDWSSNLWVTFADGTVRVYDPAFGSFSAIKYPYKVESMHFYWNNFIYTFNNGTAISSSLLFQLTVSNNSTAVSCHDLNNYSLLSRYQLNESIIYKIGYSLQDPSGRISPYVIVFCAHSLLLLFK